LTAVRSIVAKKIAKGRILSPNEIKNRKWRHWRSPARSLDMRRTNQAVTRERYPIPTVDEVIQDLNQSKVFSKLDIRLAYHQIELTPDSREILHL
jgi:hypothetical protein